MPLIAAKGTEHDLAPRFELLYAAPPLCQLRAAHFWGVLDALFRVQMRTTLHDAVRVDLLDPGFDPQSPGLRRSESRFIRPHCREADDFEDE